MRRLRELVGRQIVRLGLWVAYGRGAGRLGRHPCRVPRRRWED